MKLVANSMEDGQNPTDAGRVIWPRRLAIGLATGTAGAMFVLANGENSTLHLLNFYFNPFALLSLVAVMSNVIVLILISRLRGKSDNLVWFSVYVVCLVLGALVEFLTRLSAMPEAVLFWSTVSVLPLVLGPVAFFMFALSYIQPRQSKYVGVVVPLALAAFVMLIFDYRMLIFNQSEPAGFLATPWGGVVETGPFRGIVTAWIIGFYVLVIAMFWQFYGRLAAGVQKRQVQLFIVATVLAVGGGVVMSVAMLVAGQAHALPMGVVITAVMSAAYCYAILKYPVLVMNPTLVAANILERMNEAVISIRPDFKINYVNNGATRLLGYQPAEFARLRFTDFLSQEWSPDLLRKAMFAKSQNNEYANFNSVDMRTKLGRTVTAKLSVSQVMDEGVLQGYLVVATDITTIAETTQIIERTVQARTKEAEETKAKLESSINSLEFGFLMTNTKPDVVMVNAAAHTLFCTDRTHRAVECKAITLTAVQQHFGRRVDLAAHILTCMKHGRPQRLKDITLNDKTWRAYLSPMMSGDSPIGCVLLLQDTTAEQVLERSRDEFFSIASHELRTPLTSIRGNSAMIMQYYPKILQDKTLSEMVGDIHESSERLIGIVNDFLDMSRLEQGRITLQLERASMARIVEKVSYEMGPILKQKGLYLRLSEELRRLDDLPEVLIDQNRVKQVLFNLLGNASKFTEQGGITLNAKLEKDMVCLTVTDTGLGVSKAQQALLFHKFQQTASSTMTHDPARGTGLGLYISRLLLREMGGNLELVSSEVGRGTVFAMKVPVATPARLRRMGARPE